MQDKLEMMTETTELCYKYIPETLKIDIPGDFLYKILFDNRYVMPKNAIY